MIFVVGIGWFRRSLSGWRLAVAIIATHVLGDLVNDREWTFELGGS